MSQPVIWLFPDPATRLPLPAARPCLRVLERRAPDNEPSRICRHRGRTRAPEHQTVGSRARGDLAGGRAQRGDDFTAVGTRPVRGRACRLCPDNGKGERMNAGAHADLTSMDLVEAADAIRSRKVSSVEVTAACIRRIERMQSRLNCFIGFDPEG